MLNGANWFLLLLYKLEVHVQDWHQNFLFIVIVFYLQNCHKIAINFQVIKQQQKFEDPRSAWSDICPPHPFRPLVLMARIFVSPFHTNSLIFKSDFTEYNAFAGTSYPLYHPRHHWIVFLPWINVTLDMTKPRKCGFPGILLRIHIQILPYSITFIFIYLPITSRHFSHY